MGALPLQALAPAKINLGLRIGPLARDGRHELVTVMQSISLADELRLEWAQAGSDEVLCPGVEGPPERNLASVAVASFRAETGWEAPPVRLTIAKRVPVAAGLGGGSGDAAAALRLLAAAAQGEHDRLLALATALGSDVPAQLRPGRWLATGGGELLEELPPPAPFGVLVAPLAQPLSTAEVYAEADRLGLPRSAEELSCYREALRAALASGTALPPAELLVNDLEDAARSLCPAIDESLAGVRGSGADATLLSGSGPTVLGLFAGADGPRRAQRAAAALSDLAGPAPVAAVPVQAPFGSPGALLSQFRDSA
jgi:4-diphosphocytidyl-2-C-methyl-D-erythritol kinase